MDRIEKLLGFLKDTPGDSFLQHALALEYIKIGKMSNAQILFENILTAQPLYVGSYYHLGRLYEKLGELQKARSTYEKGMAACRKVSDNHAYNELQMALDDMDD